MNLSMEILGIAVFAVFLFIAVTLIWHELCDTEWYRRKQRYNQQWFNRR